jgi:hypothetical protein
MLVEDPQGLLSRGATRRAYLSVQIEPTDDDVEASSDLPGGITRELAAHCAQRIGDLGT